MVYLYNGIPLNNAEQWTMDSYNMDDSEKHVQTEKGMTVYFHLYEAQE